MRVFLKGGKNKITAFLLMLAITLSAAPALSACGSGSGASSGKAAASDAQQKDVSDGAGYAEGAAGNGTSSSSSGSRMAYLYYLNSTADSIERVSYTFTEPDTDGRIVELIAMQSQEPEDDSLMLLLPEGISISGYNLDDSKITVDLGGDLSSVAASRRTLMVGGLTRTFLQISGIETIDFTANGSPLEDSYGNEVGDLSLSSFVENSGKNINSYKYTTMTLYFADATGTKLLSETRKAYYLSSEPVEWAVIDELISGPEGSGHNAVLPQNTNVLSVSSQDGVCYVNFDENVRNTVMNVSEEAEFFAVVDSIIDTVPDIERVQISVNGDSRGVFRESISLEQQYTRQTVQ